MDKELKKLLDQLKQLGASTKEIERLQERFNKAGSEASKMNEVLESAKDRIFGLQEAAAFAGESFASLTSILQANLTELSKSEEVQKRALKTRRAFRDVSKELLYDEEGINVLSEKQLKNKLDKLEKGKTDLTQMAEELMFREGILQADEKISDLTSLSIKQQNERLGALQSLTEEERQLVMQSLEQFTLEEGIIRKTKSRLKEEQRINKQMGLTGDLLKSAAGAMGKLGLDSKILGDALEDAQKSMRKLAEDANNSKLDVMMGALGPLATGFGKALQDPLTILTFIGKSLLAASDTQAKFQKMTGMSATAAYGLKTEMAAVANLSGSNFITSQKLVKTYAMMTEQLGMAASAFSGDTLVDVTYMTEKLHLSAEAATQLATMSELNGKSSKKTNKELGKQLSTFNKQNKTMFSLKDLMNDIGTASKAMVLTLGKSPKALMNAAAEARKLGTNLSGVEKIADSLLDFESSIEKEMEAQLITGKQLNLSTAREAAMRGDMATVAKEVANQEAIREAFATNNVIAQQAAAEAIGLSREELAEMTYQQELLELGADKFKDKYGEVAYENLKAQGAQDKFNDAMTKMQSILGDVIGAFSPILDIFAKLMSFPLTPYIMAAVVASKALGGNFFNMFKGLDKIGPKLKDMGSKLLGMGGPAKDVAKDTLGGVKDVTKGAGDQLSKGASGAMNTPEPKASGKKIREFFEGLAAGLKSMGNMEVVKGALALIPAAIGLTAMIPGAVGAKLVEKVKGAKLAEGLMGMATGLRMMADGKVALGALALVAAGVGFTAMTIGAIGMAAVAFLGAPASAGLTALAFGLTAFGTAAMNPLTWAGIGLLAALGVALIPTAYAIGLVAPAIAAFGAIIQGALGGVADIVTSISDGFVNLLGAISIEKAAAVGMMGLGLVGLAAGAFAMAAALPILPLAALGIYALGKSLGTLEGLDLSTSLGPLAELAKSAGGLLLLGPALLASAVGITVMAGAALLMPIAAGGLLLLGGAISTLQNLPLEQIGTGLQAISSAIPGFLLLGPAMASAAIGIVALAASAPLLPFAAIGLIGLAGALALAAPLMESAMPAFEGLTKFGEAIGEIGKGMLKMGIGVAALGAGAAMLAVFGPIAAIGVTAFAAGLAAAGILVIPAIPGLLAMAGAMYVLAPAMAMLAENGAGLLAASAGLLMLGPAFIGLAAGALVLTAALPVLAGAALGLSILAGGMAVMNQVDPAGLAASLQQFSDIGPGLVVAGQGLIKMAGGMIAFSAAAGIMAMSSLAIWLALAPLGALAAMSTPLASTANSLTQIATALATIKEALTGIETEKLNELQGLIMTTAFAAPAVAAAGAITSLINGITGGGEEGGDDAVAQKLDEILQAIREGGDVYMDGNKVGESLMLSSVKSS